MIDLELRSTKTEVLKRMDRPAEGDRAVGSLHIYLQ